MPGTHDDWMDYDHWPGPSHEETLLEILRNTFQLYGRALGKTAQLMASMPVEIQRFSYHAQPVTAGCLPVWVSDPKPPPSDIMQAAIDRKNAQAREAGKAWTYDRMGRRLY